MNNPFNTELPPDPNRPNDIPLDPLPPGELPPGELPPGELPPGELPSTTPPSINDAALEALIAEGPRMPPSPGDTEYDDYVYDGIKYNYSIQEATQPPPEGRPIPLLEPYFQNCGLAVLYGPPDSGKSQWLRQLSITVALGREQFLGLPLNLQHNRALYVTTEDDVYSHGERMAQMIASMGVRTEHLKNGLDTIDASVVKTPDIPKVIERQISKRPVDLVVVDVFSDVITGRDMNSNSDMRLVLKEFDRLAKAYRCLLIFNHHPTKSGYTETPDLAKMLGAGAFGQKCRGIFELRGEKDGVTKYFSTIKANHVLSRFKVDALILTYSEDTGLFTNTGRTIPKQEIAQQQTSEYTDWKQIFNGQIEAKTKDLVKAIMDLYGLQSRAAHNRLQQLTSSRHGYYRNPYLDDESSCEESNCEGIVE